MSNLAEMPGTCGVIADRERAGEVTQLALLSRREGALVLCRSEGELTQEIFDAPWHVGCAFVAAEHLTSLSWALCGPLGDGDGTVAGALRRMFADPEVQFSDLLDLMDSAGVPYEYRAFAPDKAVFRPRESAA